MHLIKKCKMQIFKVSNFRVLLILLAVCFTSCSDDDDNKPADETYKGVPLVILDTDIGSSTDDLFALELLYRYSDMGKCKLLGVVVDREGEDCAALVDVMNTYFHYPDVPIGLIRNGVKDPKVWIDYKGMPDYTDDKGVPLFRRTVKDLNTLPDGYKLYRQLLAAQPDHSVSICSVGFVTSLAQLLESGPDEYSNLGGVELVRSKVKCCYIMGGVFGDAIESDYNFTQAMSFSEVFFRLWPSDVDMMFSGQEVGEKIDYRPEQVIADISWTDIHPIKQVYMNCICDTGQRMWDPLTVIHAIEGDDAFVLSPRGVVTLTKDAETIFHTSSTGNCRYQIVASTQWAQQKLDFIRQMTIMH